LIDWRARRLVGSLHGRGARWCADRYRGSVSITIDRMPILSNTLRCGNEK